MSSWKVGDAVAIGNRMRNPDGFEITLTKGETATITEVYDDGWYEIRLHKSGIVIDFMEADLYLCAQETKRKYLVPPAFAYPIATAAALCLLFASESALGPTKAESNVCAGTSSHSLNAPLRVVPNPG